MDWDDLRYLLAVDRRRTLAAAAKELNVTKATASRRLAALEASLGARLVERKPSGLTLTDAGRAAVEAANEMDRLTASLEQHRATARVRAVSDFVVAVLTRHRAAVEG